MTALTVGTHRGLWLAIGNIDAESRYPLYAMESVGFTWCTAEGCEDGLVQDGTNIDPHWETDKPYDFGVPCKVCGGKGIL